MLREACNFIKTKLWHRCFAMNSAKFSGQFFTERLRVTASEGHSLGKIFFDWNCQKFSSAVAAYLQTSMRLSFYEICLLKQIKACKLCCRGSNELENLKGNLSYYLNVKAYFWSFLTFLNVYWYRHKVK